MQGPRKKIIFGHHPCIDGIASMWAIGQRFPGEDIRYYGMNYDSDTSHSETIRTAVDALGEDKADICFVDYFPNQTEIISELLADGHWISVLDHHQSSQHRVNHLQDNHPDDPNLNAEFSYEHSGGSIVWDTLFPEGNMPEIIKLVKRMDLLALEGEEDAKAAAYIDSFPISDNLQENMRLFDCFHEVIEKGGIEALAKRGEICWQEGIDAAKTLLSTKRIAHIDGIDYPAVQLREMSDLSRGSMTWLVDTLTTKTQPVMFLVTQKPGGLVSLSLRVRPEMSNITEPLTSLLVEKIQEHAPEKDRDKISGGGRGLTGQIGQSAINMPTSVASMLGLLPNPIAQIRTGGHAR